MGSFGGPNLVNEGLVVAIDTGAKRCYEQANDNLWDLTGDIYPPITTTTREVDDVLYDASYVKATWPTDLVIDDNTTHRTWEVVIKPLNSTGTFGLFGHIATPSCSSFCNGGIQIRSNRLTFSWYDNSAYQHLGTIVPQVGKYYHVVATFDAADQKPRIYVNGVLDVTHSVATNMNFNNGMLYYSLGCRQHTSGATDQFNGYIPVARFYKGVALSLEQVQQNFNAYQSRFQI